METPDATLPRRDGPRPRTTPGPPHTQADQQPAVPLRDDLVRRITALDGVVTGGSRRAPPGTVGWHLAPGHAGHDSSAFLIDAEFAHVHPDEDASLHAILPEPLRGEAVAAGWAEPHPWAGRPTVSPGTVMIYAPRDPGELDVVAGLVTASWRNARR